MTEKEKHKIQSSLPFWERASLDQAPEERSILENGFLFRHYHIKRSGRTSLEGSCRILFFTDLHLRYSQTSSRGGGLPFLSWKGGEKVYANLQEAIDLFSPEVLLFGGDLTGEFSALPVGMEILHSLKSDAPKFAVMGNWDKRRRSHLSRKAWEELFSRNGFPLLCNEEAPVKNGVLYGMDDFKSGLPHYRSLRERNWKEPPGFQLVLTHNPDTIPFLGETFLAAETDLVLCGHTHGGQILLPGCHKALLTSTYSRNYLARGAFFHKKWGTKFLVSSGIGTTWIHKRCGVPPEILGITLEY